MKGFIFKYNKYGKPSSKSYVAPKIEELEILSYWKTKDDETGKTIFGIVVNEGVIVTDNIKEQLTLFFMNKYGIKSYSSIVLDIKNEVEI
jgi:hypothetical protein